MSVLVIVVLAVAGYATWAFFHPYRKCPRCGGTGVNRGSTGRRWGQCRRCKGARSIRTIGARALHRGVRSARRRDR